MRVGFAVSVRVGDERVSSSAAPAELAALAERNGIEVDSADDILRFTATSADVLAVLAGPLTTWWQGYGPSADVALRFVSAHGVSELTYSDPDRAVDDVRRLIRSESGPVYEPGEAPGVLRRSAAYLLRLAGGGFTASTVSVDDADGVLVVTVAGRDLDDRLRSIEFQTFDSSYEHYDPDDDEGYCLLNEEQIPAYGGLVALQLRGRTLRLELTRDAARAWGPRSQRIRIRLRLDPAEIERLCGGLERIFACQTGQRPRTVDLRP